jgi:serine/threonine-protein kinase
MDPAIGATPEGAERFRREAHAAASLRSTHVVQVLDYGVDEGTPYLVMELLHGESLTDCLEREGRLSLARTLEVMTQVGRAISRAHGAGIVHRDLKPDNIYLVREDDQDVVKVLDFGIAKTSGLALGDLKTQTGMIMGTPHYMSPEQAEGKRTVDHRTDLWAMAVITCECITGTRPFRGETWGELFLNVCARPIPLPSTLSSVPRGFDEWFVKATNRDPEQRYQSANELLAALRELVESSGGVGHARASVPGVEPLVVAATTASPFAATSPRQGGSPRVTPVPSTVVDRALSAPTAEERRSNSRLEAVPGGAVNRIPLKRGTVALLAGLGLLPLVGLGGATYYWLRASEPEPLPLVLPSVTATELVSSPSLAVPAVTQATINLPNRGAPLANGSGTKPAPMHERGAQPMPVAPGVQTEREQPAAKVRPSAAANASKGLRCFTDPFTGIVRLDGSTPRTAGVQTYPCKLNSFTGQYQRL